MKETQVSASSWCDYPPPVCGPGSGHIGQGRKIQGTHRPSTNVRGHIGREHIVHGISDFLDGEKRATIDCSKIPALDVNR
jgi:hypothetical protein